VSQVETAIHVRIREGGEILWMSFLKLFPSDSGGWRRSVSFKKMVVIPVFLSLQFDFSKSIFLDMLIRVNGSVKVIK
jgi:hypothetical protein